MIFLLTYLIYEKKMKNYQNKNPFIYEGQSAYIVGDFS